MAALPGAIVFDLDGTVWAPEMYELWGGGAPFTAKKNGAYVTDRRGVDVQYLGETREIIEELLAAGANQSTGPVLSVASTCDEPQWARECLRKFLIDAPRGKVPLDDAFLHQQIYKANKRTHLKKVHEATGIPFADMVFFDNQMNNIRDVEPLGVHCVYCPDGVTRSIWSKGLQEWRRKQGKL